MKITFSPANRRRIATFVNPVKNEVQETYRYYRDNVRYGWERGRKLAKRQQRNCVTSFAIKSISTAAHARIRGKDILPLIGCGLFSFTNPFVGMGLVGFALGKSLNKLALKFYKGIKSSAEYLMPKVPPNTGLGI